MDRRKFLKLITGSFVSTSLPAVAVVEQYECIDNFEPPFRKAGMPYAGYKERPLGYTYYKRKY